VLKLSNRQIRRFLNLIAEFQEIEGWPEISLVTPLVLLDVLEALGASRQQICQLLGEDAMAYIDCILSAADAISESEQCS
jgi:hypothetical protein